MIIKNDSPYFKKIKGILVRPWRSIIVPDEEEKENKINYDLNGDGVFDKKDKSIAGKILSAKRKRKKGE